MTTSCSRCPFKHLRYAEDNVKTLDKLSKYCRWSCCCIIIPLQFKDYRNAQCSCAKLLFSFPEGIGCVLPSRLILSVKLHLHLTKPLHVLRHCFGDCAHHPARFIIFAQLALLIMLIFPILPIVGTWKITQTVSDSNHHLLIGHFRLSVGTSGVFSLPFIILILLIRCLCVFRSVSCPSGLSRNIMLDPFFFVFMG